MSKDRLTKQCGKEIQNLVNAPDVIHGGAEPEYERAPCLSYIPDEHKECDFHLMLRYKDILGTAGYDCCDHQGMGPAHFEEEKVYAAIRAAERN